VTKDVVSWISKRATNHSNAKTAWSSLPQRPVGKPLKKTDGTYSFVAIGASKAAGGTSTKKHR
jgi:hypothetical protein